MKTKSLITGIPLSSGHLNRRNFIKGTGLAAASGIAGCGESTVPVSSVQKLRIPVPTYESIGAKTFINCSDAYTILSGSLMPAEVKQSMMRAAEHYVHMDNLAECVGSRLAELTGAEWGCIMSGAGACLSAAACACIAGADPEKMAMLPDTSSMKNECIMPKKHRNVYDRCIWMTGVKMVEVNSTEEMEAAVNDRTAMIATFGAVFDRGGIIPLEDIVRIGKKHSVPVFVDAAAEQPNVPNIYIEAGVNLVAYSGGKYIRGPQDSGILLGRKDLCQAAFLNMAPHHAFGRPMKISKETIMGGLTALDLWINGRDHEAEWKEWERILDYIAQKAMQVPSVTTEILPPSGRSNVVMRMRINWDQNSVKLTTEEFTKQMFEGNPRIYVFGNYINPAMMEEGEEVPVAKRVYEILSAAAV